MALKFNINTATIKKPVSVVPAVKKSTSKPPLKKSTSKLKKNKTKLTKNNLNFLRSLQ